MPYEVVYGHEDCALAHADEDDFEYERAAREQARIHNGLCPHFGLPMACARVREVELPDGYAATQGVSQA